MGIGVTEDAGPKEMPRNTAQDDSSADGDLEKIHRDLEEIYGLAKEYVTPDNTGGDIPDELKEPAAEKTAAAKETANHDLQAAFEVYGTVTAVITDGNRVHPGSETGVKKVCPVTSPVFAINLELVTSSRTERK